MESNRFTVMFAQTDADWHSQAIALLEPQGVRTIFVRTGREAVNQIEAGQVHVAVLDQQLPQLNGLQVVKLTRELKPAPHSILLARDMSNHLLHEALVMKVFSVLAKPVDVNVLLETLARIMKRHYAGKWPA